MSIKLMPSERLFNIETDEKIVAVSIDLDIENNVVKVNKALSKSVEYPMDIVGVYNTIIDKECPIKEYDFVDNY